METAGGAISNKTGRLQMKKESRRIRGSHARLQQEKVPWGLNGNAGCGKISGRYLQKQVMLKCNTSYEIATDPPQFRAKTPRNAQNYTCGLVASQPENQEIKCGYEAFSRAGRRLWVRGNTHGDPRRHCERRHGTEEFEQNVLGISSPTNGQVAYRVL
jgi:hypothetical protein